MFIEGHGAAHAREASSEELTEPFDAFVVTLAHSELATIPLRCSLPSRLPPVVPSSAASRSIPASFCAGEPFCSAA